MKDDQVGMLIALAKVSLSSDELPKEDGRETYHIKINLPKALFFVANRSIINTYYQAEDKETGMRYLMDSSTGNEAVTNARKKEIGSDVMVNVILNYKESKPYEGGMEINQVMITDVAGYVPNFIKTILANKMASSGKEIADYVMHGTEPKDLFSQFYWAMDSDDFFDCLDFYLTHIEHKEKELTKY